MARFRTLGTLAAAALIAGACSSPDNTDTMAADTIAPATASGMDVAPAGMSIVETAQSNPTFSTLVTAIDSAGIAADLQGPGPYTVFAPTNDAFAAVPSDALTSLLNDKPALTRVLQYHVVPGRLMAADLQGMTSVTTLEGTTLTVRVEGGNVYVGDAQVVQADVNASNGVVHAINAVLMPQM